MSWRRPGMAGWSTSATPISRAAFEVAADAAEPGEVVLLAPACASFDQYTDYAERGDHFRSPRGGTVVKALRLAALGPRRRSGAPPVEHSLLLTATLCLVALGVVMVFSASSTTSLLGEAGDGAYYLKRTVLFGVFGLIAMRILAIRGVGVDLSPDAVDHGRLDRAPGARPRPGNRDRGQRGQALAWRRPLPDPAIGDREGRAGPPRGGAPRHSAEADQVASGHGPVPPARWPGLPPGRDGAGPGSAMVACFTAVALLVAAWGEDANAGHRSD